jgi:hypothetical protein
MVEWFGSEPCVPVMQGIIGRATRKDGVAVVTESRNWVLS